MKKWGTRTAGLFAAFFAGAAVSASSPAVADGNLQNVNHIIIVMMENHSFDNYLGALPYVPGTPYHEASGGIARGCAASDHTCVDGLKCRDVNGTLKCRNSNKSNGPGRVQAFHDPRLCTGPDLDHSWDGTHMEVNFTNPENTFKHPRNNGFIRQNAVTEACGGSNSCTGPGQDIAHDALGYYTDADLPFYYGLAETFGLSDRYFASVLGQTFPNRAYEVAATSFGHLTTAEIICQSPQGCTGGGYQPITGTIYDLMNQNGISWIDYYSDLPYSSIFHQAQAGHTKPQAQFAVDAGTTAALLPQVAFIDPSALKTQNIGGHIYETDEHPPNDIRAGEYFVSNIVNALRNGPHWADSLLIITYDEHGGYYDHVREPAVAQGGQATPDGINPGQCEDLSNPPASEQPGGGAECGASATSEAPGICPGFSPTGPYPSKCPTFNQLGVRLPFIVVSPFAKPHYVSHVVSDHTSLLALIEKRFLPVGAHLTARDQNANDLEDLFDFDNSPSLSSTVGTAPMPQPNDPGCPFM